MKRRKNLWKKTNGLNTVFVSKDIQQVHMVKAGLCSQYDRENIQDIINAKNNGVIFSIGRA